MLMGSALIANCIEHSSGYLRIRECFYLFLCHKCDYSVIADALPSFEEKEKNTLQLKVSSFFHLKRFVITNVRPIYYGLDIC